LLEDGNGENVGGVEGIDLLFQVAYFDEEASHGFAKLFFLGLQLGALGVSRGVPRIVRILLRLGRCRGIDRGPAAGCGYGRAGLQEKERARGSGEIFKEAAASIEHDYLR
jgi:hypothetical protein